MKAHRRKGIPTLMLQTGGKVEVKPYSESPIRGAKPRDLPKSPAGRRFYIPGIPGDYEGAESLMRREYFRNLKPLTGVQLEDISADDYETFKQAISPLAGLRSLAKNTPGRGREAYIPFSALKNRDPRPEYRDKIASAVGSLSRLPEGFVPQVVDPLKQSLESELSRLSPRLGSPAPGYGSVQEALLESAKSSSEAAAQEAARQEQESAAPQPPETPAEAAQAEQAAETAKASQAAASVSSPEEEALRQATGAPSSAEEAAAAAKSGDLSQGPSLVQGKDGTTIANIMGSADAQVDEKERLNELKTTFGLNLSDMEKAAPGIAFSLSLMGAQRAPGESVFNALARSAGSAGEGALKAKLALDAKERAIDSSLVSTVLNEKKVAEDYARNKTWVAVWDGGFDKNGVATASFYRMNQRQQDEAFAAGIPIVPTGFLGNAMTAVGARTRAGATAKAGLTKEIRALAGGTKVKIDIAGQSVDAFNYTSPGGMRFTIPADVSAAVNNLNANLNSSAMNMKLTAGLKGAVNSGKVAGFGNVFRGLIGKGQSLTFGFTPTEEMSSLDIARKINSGATGAFNAAKVNAALGAMDPNKVSQGLTNDELEKIYGKEAVEARDKGDTNALNKIISSKTPKLTNIVGMPDAKRKGEGDSAYETRIYYKAVQNALAAQLAPILLGESGRTISDADRVRVTTLLGGFADYSRAGASTSKEEMLESIGQLERILGKYAEKAEGEAKSFMGNMEQAMRTPSFNPLLGNVFMPTDADRENLELLAASYAEFPEDLKRAGSQTPPPTSNTPTFNATDVLPVSQ